MRLSSCCLLLWMLGALGCVAVPHANQGGTATLVVSYDPATRATAFFEPPTTPYTGRVFIAGPLPEDGGMLEVFATSKGSHARGSKSLQAHGDRGIRAGGPGIGWDLRTHPDPPAGATWEKGQRWQLVRKQGHETVGDRAGNLGVTFVYATLPAH